MNCAMCGNALHTAFSKFCAYKWIVELECAEPIQAWVMQIGVLQYDAIWPFDTIQSVANVFAGKMSAAELKEMISHTASVACGWGTPISQWCWWSGRWSGRCCHGCILQDSLGGGTFENHARLNLSSPSFFLLCNIFVIYYIYIIM